MLFISARVRTGAGKSPLFGDCREIWRRIGGVFRGGRLLFQFSLCFAFQLFALIVLTRTLFLAFVEARSTSAWHRRLLINKCLYMFHLGTPRPGLGTTRIRPTSE